jgi:hypothetical protein
MEHNEPTTASTPRPVVALLVETVARAVDADEPVVPVGRLVDALLDVRNDVDAAAVVAVDEALAACAHRTLVPTDEASELVAAVSAAAAAEPAPV